MKYIIFISMFVSVFSLNIFAQSRLQAGVFAGVLDSKSAWKYPDGLSVVRIANQPSSTRWYFTYGAFAEYNISEKISARAEGSWLEKGFTYNFGLENQLLFRYLSVTPQLGWQFSPGFQLFIGPEVNFLTFNDYETFFTFSEGIKKIEFLLSGKLQFTTAGRLGFFLEYSHPLTPFFSMPAFGLEPGESDLTKAIKIEIPRSNRILTVGASYRLLGLFPKKEKEG